MITQPTRPIAIAVRLSSAQASELRRRLMDLYPPLAALSQRQQCQIVHSGGKLSIAAVRGGQMPETPTEADVKELLNEVKAAIPDPAHWRQPTAQRGYWPQAVAR